MSRGPAQPGCWRGEVRASGRSPSRSGGPIRYPAPREEGLSSAGKDPAGAATAQEREHFGQAVGSRTGESSETREAQGVEFGKGQKGGKRGKEKNG